MLINNNISNVWLGIDVFLSSSNNKIYHNNLINNTNQANDNGNNSWDNGYPSGGNYWSDWTSPDNYSGVHQNESGSDGIVDNPYLISGGVNQDCYPFVNPDGWLDTTPPVVTITSPVNGSVVTDPNVTVIGMATDDVGIVTMCYAHISERGGAAGCGSFSKSSTNVSINWTVHLQQRTNTMSVTAEDEAGNSGSASVTVIYKEENISTFDTGPGTYPSIPGTHNGTIMPSSTITVNKLYTYPCPGTGGHTEYVKIWNTSWDGAEAYWSGYQGDWHNISFNKTFTLVAHKTYKYTLKTGSYPQIHHIVFLEVANGVGTITCDKFIDAHGRVFYYDWIPAIRLWAE